MISLQTNSGMSGPYTFKLFEVELELKSGEKRIIDFRRRSQYIFGNEIVRVPSSSEDDSAYGTAVRAGNWNTMAKRIIGNSTGVSYSPINGFTTTQNEPFNMRIFDTHHPVQQLSTAGYQIRSILGVTLHGSFS